MTSMPQLKFTDAGVQPRRASHENPRTVSTTHRLAAKARSTHICSVCPTPFARAVRTAISAATMSSITWPMAL